MTIQTLKSNLYEIKRMHNQRRQNSSSNSSHQMLPMNVMIKRQFKADGTLGHGSTGRWNESLVTTPVKPQVIKSNLSIMTSNCKLHFYLNTQINGHFYLQYVLNT